MATGLPSMSIGAVAEPVSSVFPCVMALTAASAPPAARTVALRASLPTLTNFGKAVAARMPRITMTTISSISVKPPWARAARNCNPFIGSYQEKIRACLLIKLCCQYIISIILLDKLLSGILGQISFHHQCTATHGFQFAVPCGTAQSPTIQRLQHDLSR